MVGFPAGSFQEQFLKVPPLLYKWVRHSFILELIPISLWLVVVSWIEAVEGAAPNLTFFPWSFWIIWQFFSIFPETSPFDFYDVIDKSGVWGSGKMVDFGVMQMWVWILLHTPVLWLDQVTEPLQVAVFSVQNGEQYYHLTALSSAWKPYSASALWWIEQHL